MTDRNARRVAWPLAVLALGIVATTATLAVMNRAAFHSIDQANPIEAILPVGFALMGALITSRNPRTPIGWIFLGIAFFGALPGLGHQYFMYDYLRHTQRLPGARWAAFMIDWPVSFVFPTGLAAFIFLLFPNGRLLSPRWRWVARAAVVMDAISLLLNVTENTIEVAGGPKARNPLQVHVLGNLWNGPLGAVLYIGGLGLLVAAMVSLVLRFRRSRGDERQQLKWFAYAAGATVI
ncbi:MAG TPA: hypothetical protein VF972_12010, partial [Actinomycetota bacterium]